jgi:hypothetical protein
MRSTSKRTPTIRIKTNSRTTYRRTKRAKLPNVALRFH